MSSDNAPPRWFWIVAVVMFAVAWTVIVALALQIERDHRERASGGEEVSEQPDVSAEMMERIRAQLESAKVSLSHEEIQGMSSQAVREMRQVAADRGRGLSQAEMMDHVMKVASKVIIEKAVTMIVEVVGGEMRKDLAP